MSDKGSDDVPESLFSEMEFMVQDLMIRRGLHQYVGLIISGIDHPVALEFKLTVAPDDATHHSTGRRTKGLDE